MRPDPGEAIGLQFQLLGEPACHPGIALPRCLYFFFYPEQILHVVPDLVRKHVCFRELSRRAEALS